MHPNPEALQRLHQKWAAETLRRRFAPTDAVTHYLAAVQPQHASDRCRRWVERCAQLEAYVAAHGALPTLASSSEGDDSRRLVEWMRYQRRNEDRLSDYRRERLGCVPGFSWDPREDAWHDALHDVEMFVREHRRRPRRRSADPDEARLAIWFRNQGLLFKRGSISEERLEMLVQLNRRINALTRRR